MTKLLDERAAAQFGERLLARHQQKANALVADLHRDLVTAVEHDQRAIAGLLPDHGLVAAVGLLGQHAKWLRRGAGIARTLPILRHLLRQREIAGVKALDLIRSLCHPVGHRHIGTTVLCCDVFDATMRTAVKLLHGSNGTLQVEKLFVHMGREPMARRAPRKMAETTKTGKPNDIGLTSPQSNPTEMMVGDRGLAFTVYVLYLLGYITGITAIIGVIIAYLQAGSANPLMKSHYTFQMRTFVIGLIYFLVGLLFLYLAVGALILLWAIVWSLVRNVKGLLALNRNGPIANPESWMFGD